MSLSQWWEVKSQCSSECPRNGTNSESCVRNAFASAKWLVESCHGEEMMTRSCINRSRAMCTRGVTTTRVAAGDQMCRYCCVIGSKLASNVLPKNCLVRDLCLLPSLLRDRRAGHARWPLAHPREYFGGCSSARWRSPFLRGRWRRYNHDGYEIS